MLIFESPDRVFVESAPSDLDVRRSSEPVKQRRTFLLPPFAGGVKQERAFVAATIAGKPQERHVQLGA
jgi:hypothetical protein